MGKMLYVGNLAYAVTNKALEALFSKEGVCESASVVVDRDTGQSLGFVEMSSDPEAQKAILQPNGQELKGRAIKANEARPSSEVLHMLLKVSCVRCRLSALWTDDPDGFSAPRAITRDTAKRCSRTRTSPRSTPAAPSRRLHDPVLRRQAGYCPLRDPIRRIPNARHIDPTPP